MVALKPEANPAGRYSVSETCSLLGIHRNTLRNYTDAGVIRCEYRKSSFRKVYTGQEIVRFWNAVM